jgi:hypothetical protein
VLKKTRQGSDMDFLISLLGRNLQYGEQRHQKLNIRGLRGAWAGTDSERSGGV